MRVRTIVTGQSSTGTSVIVSDEKVEPITVSLMPGGEFHRLWGADATVKLPSTGVQPQAPLYFPPVGGFRFGFFTIGPDAVSMGPDFDIGSALAEIGAKLPGMVEVLEPEHPGMHTTDTVDFDVVVSGEVHLELDDGAEVHLRQGDCVVQNGTRHAWHNRSAEPCVMAVAIVGAQRAAT
jgi:mannose-6-phosphate isomerase-like protein (cupin superfamily)